MVSDLTYKSLKYLIEGVIVFLLFKYVPKNPMPMKDIAMITVIIVIAIAVCEHIYEYAFHTNSCESRCAARNEYMGGNVSEPNRCVAVVTQDSVDSIALADNASSPALPQPNASSEFPAATPIVGSATVVAQGPPQVAGPSTPTTQAYLNSIASATAPLNAPSMPTVAAPITQNSVAAGKPLNPTEFITSVSPNNSNMQNPGGGGGARQNTGPDKVFTSGEVGYDPTYRPTVPVAGATYDRPSITQIKSGEYKIPVYKSPYTKAIGSREDDGVLQNEQELTDPNMYNNFEIPYVDYNNMPLFEVNSGSFEYGYSFLPPTAWYPTPPHPPVCVSEKRAPVCPVYTNGTTVDLKEWDYARRIFPPDQINTAIIEAKLNSGR